MFLHVDGLSAGYGPLTALWNVSLEVAAGDFVAIIGPNGAGKTTLMAALTGLIPAKSGRIVFDGEEITQLRADRRAGRGIALSPEGRRLFPQMTVRDNLLAGAYLAPGNAERRARLDEVETIFPRLAERKDQIAYTLSGGEQQMVAIGRALMSRPRLLLLDEPSLGLAPVIVRDLFSALERIHARGVAIVLVEQNVVESLTFSRFAYLLENGRVGRAGLSADLLADPHIAATYLGV